MTEAEKNEAEQRLLEVLLTEHVGTVPGQKPTHSFPASPPRAAAIRDDATLQSAAPRQHPWLAAAVALLGLGVVTATWMLRAEPTAGVGLQDPRGAQDPQALQLVTAPDVATFLRWLGDAKRLRLVRHEAVGAGTHEDATGRSDRLELVAWPEVAEVEGEALQPWLVALRASAEKVTAGRGVDDVYHLELVLGGDRLLRCFTSWGGGESQIWIADGHPIAPDAALHELFEREHLAIERRHRLTRGRVETATELAALPTDQRCLDVSVELAARAGEPACLASVERLCLRGDPGQAAWNTARNMPGLRELELVGCSFGKASCASLATLPGLRSLVLRECAPLPPANGIAALHGLQKLHLIGTRLGDGVDLSLVSSLPSLREFGLRIDDRGMSEADLGAIVRSKLQRLLLVDVPSGLDLTALGELPTLRDLVLVGALDDDDLRTLRGVRGLRSLVLRNAAVTAEGVTALQQALPGCRLDWGPNARWFRTEFAFAYKPVSD